MTLQAGWLAISALAVLGAAILAAALVRLRRVSAQRRELIAGLRSLAAGDLGRRLMETGAGGPASAVFNQAARDLETRQEAIRSSLSSLRRLAAGLPGQALIEVNAEGEIGEVLGDLEGLTGYTHVGAVGRPASFLFVAEGDWERLLRAAGGPEAAPREPQQVPVRRAGGELTLLEVELVPDPERKGHHLVLSRVAGRKALEEELQKAEQRVQEAESRVRALAEGIADGAAILVEGRIASANERFAALSGIPVSGLIGRHFGSLAAPRDQVAAFELAAGRLEAPGEEIDLTLRRPGGDEITVAVTAGRSAFGERQAVVVVVRDVTRRRTLERSLALSGAWFDAALEATGEGLAVLDIRPEAGRARVALANSAFLKLLALPGRQLPALEEIEAGFTAVLEEPERALDLLASLHRQPYEARQVELATRQEPTRILELGAVPVRDPSGRPAGCLLRLRDVTGPRTLEAGLRQEAERLTEARQAAETAHADLEKVNAELATRLGELSEANRELKEIDEMKSNLLANVSHELQTPLVSIKGYTEMILRGDLGAVSEEQRRGLEVSQRNIQRLIGLIDQLLAFSRDQEKLAELTLETFPLWQVMDDTIQLLGELIAEKGLRVTTRYRTERLTVMADRDLVSQVLINLIGNAVKYNRPGGEVAITVRSGSADELVVEIRDTGIGIPREEQARVFERGYRASTAAGTRGSGIGLNLVQEILRRHGCQIRVDSTPGEGSTFSFTLPLAPADDGPGGDRAVPAPGGAGPHGVEEP